MDVLQLSDPGTQGDTLYRMRNPARALGSLPGWSVTEIGYDHAELSTRALVADLLILHASHNFDIFPLVTARKEAGKPTVVEVPDFFLNPPPHSTAFRHWSQSAVKFTFCNLIRLADLVQTPSSVLTRAMRAFNPNTITIPNFLTSIPPLRPAKDPATFTADTPFLLGWGGSSGHARDIAGAMPFVSDWLSKHPDCKFALMGDAFIRDLSEKTANTTFTPAGSLEDYYKFVSTLDLAIAPIDDVPYNRCRSDVKWLENAVCGVPGIYANVGPYRELPAESAMTYDNPEKITELLEWLYDSWKSGKGIYYNIRETAYKHAATRSLDENIQYTVNAYLNLFKTPPAPSSNPGHHVCEPDENSLYLRDIVSRPITEDEFAKLSNIDHHLAPAIRADFLLGMGRYWDVINLLNSVAWKYADESPIMHHLLGRAYLLAGEKKQAEWSLAKAANQAPILNALHFLSGMRNEVTKSIPTPSETVARTWKPKFEQACQWFDSTVTLAFASTEPNFEAMISDEKEPGILEPMLVGTGDSSTASESI